MKKILALALALLMLASCGCGLVPSVEDDVDPSDIADNGELVNLAASQSEEVRVIPFDRAYVRSGTYADKNWKVINQELGLDTNTEEVLALKNNGTPPGNNTREILLSFDLTKIAELEYAHVYLTLSFTKTTEGQTYNAYKLDPDSWDGDKVTYNTRPAFTNKIASNIVADNLVSADLTDAVNAALAAGEKVLSVGIAGAERTTGDSAVNPKTTYLVATTGDQVNNFVYNLVEDETENKAIWDYAQGLVNDWLDRYLELKAEDTYTADLIVSDEDEFSKIVYSGNSGFGNWSLANVNKPHATRTYEALDDLGDYTDYDKVYPMDIYGGWMDPSMQQEATGFFYSKKLGGRWYIIDPLGFPCYIRTISGPSINYLGSQNQKNAALKKYGSTEKFNLATVRWLKDQLGFNSGRTMYTEIESPLVVQTGLGIMSGYGSKLGTNKGGGGSTTFTENNTMNVFEPGFVEFAENKCQTTDMKNVDNPWMLGYTTDNELPMDVNMLINYLSIDPGKEINYYSYAAAWSWLMTMTGEENPSSADIDDELLELFRGFVYDRYFSVVREAFDKSHPNHMLLGCRFLTKVKDAPWVLRFAALYLDCVTINWYGQWTPDANDIYEISRNMDLPMMVTEFYTKALENDGSFDDPNDPLKNTRGAGWIVRTQQDRGDFYENFTLRLLESKHFVGWQWHQYLDDDDSPEVIYKNGVDGEWRDQSNIDANKGIVNNWHEPYEELCASMAQINLNVYRLAQHFDAKYAARAAAQKDE